MNRGDGVSGSKLQWSAISIGLWQTGKRNRQLADAATGQLAAV